MSHFMGVGIFWIDFNRTDLGCWLLTLSYPSCSFDFFIHFAIIFEICMIIFAIFKMFSHFSHSTVLYIIWDMIWFSIFFDFFHFSTKTDCLVFRFLHVV